MWIKYVSCDNSEVVEEIIQIEGDGEVLICKREKGDEFEIHPDKLLWLLGGKNEA